MKPSTAERLRVKKQIAAEIRKYAEGRLSGAIKAKYAPKPAPKSEPAAEPEPLDGLDDATVKQLIGE